MLATKAILHGAGDLRLEEFSLEEDRLCPGEVLVATDVTALSTGTDLGNYLGDSTYVPGAPAYPRQIGYSNAGTVLRTGEGVRSLAPGNRVFSMKPHASAFIAHQGDLLVPIPEGVPAPEASLAYLTQLALAALRQAGYQPGENVAIVGLGVIGLCAAGLARAMGARVVAIGNSKLRCDLALAAGAHAAALSDDAALRELLDREFGTTGVDIALLTANSWDAYRLSMEIVRQGGRVSVLGFPGRAQEPPEFNPLDPRWLYAKQLTLLGAGGSPRIECAPADLRFNLRRNLEFILDRMASGGLRLAPVISHRLPARRMREAYELAKAHSKELSAAVFDWHVGQ